MTSDPVLKPLRVLQVNPVAQRRLIFLVSPLGVNFKNLDFSGNYMQVEYRNPFKG